MCSRPRCRQNLKGLYWKTYRRGAESGPLCDGCTFWTTIEGPGGDGLVEFRNTSFVGVGMRINHHCNVNGLATGGLCAPHYLITGSSAPRYVLSEAAGQSSVLVTYGGRTRYLSGPSGANIAFDASSCARELLSRQDWIGCPDSFQLRVIKIYSPDRGTLTVTADGVTVRVPFRNQGLPQGPMAYAGGDVLPTCTGTAPSDCLNYMWPEGYTFVVKGGSTVSVQIENELPTDAPKHDLFYVDYGHAGWPEADVAQIQLSVNGTSYLSGSCALRTDHDRSWLTPYGPAVGDAGVWRSCAASGPWSTRYQASDVKRYVYEKHGPAPPSPPPPPPSPPSPPSTPPPSSPPPQSPPSPPSPPASPPPTPPPSPAPSPPPPPSAPPPPPSEVCQERPDERRCWGGCGRNLWACVSYQPGGLCGACSGRPWTGHPKCESTCQVRVRTPS